MKHAAPLSVLAFLFLLYFVLPFIGGDDAPALRASRCVARGDAGLLGLDFPQYNDQRCDVERLGEARRSGEGSHEKE